MSMSLISRIGVAVQMLGIAHACADALSPTHSLPHTLSHTHSLSHTLSHTLHVQILGIAAGDHASVFAPDGALVFIRPPPALEHIPLYSPLYGDVQREGLVTCCISFSLPPPSPTHQTTPGDHASVFAPDGALVFLLQFSI